MGTSSLIASPLPLRSLRLPDDEVPRLKSAVERAFGVSLAEFQWRDGSTAGDLETAVLRALSSQAEPWDRIDRICSRRVRRAIAAMPDVPSSVPRFAKLADLGLSNPRRFIRRVRRATGTPIGAPGPSRMGRWGGNLLGAGLLGGMLLQNTPFVVVFLAAPVGLAMLGLDRGAFGDITLDDLIRDIVNLNSRKLSEAWSGKRPEVVWRWLRSEVADVVGYPAARITRKTRLRG